MAELYLNSCIRLNVVVLSLLSTGTTSSSPCSRVLHEKLIVAHLVKKSPPLYGIRIFSIMFTTVPTTSPHLESDESNHRPPFLFLDIDSDIILQSTNGFSKQPLSFRSSYQNSLRIFVVSGGSYMPHSSHTLWLEHSDDVGRRVQLMQAYPASCYLHFCADTTVADLDKT